MFALAVLSLVSVAAAIGPCCPPRQWEGTLTITMGTYDTASKTGHFTEVRYNQLPHNNPCFQCDIAITNFLVLHTCKIRFHDVIGQSTVHMYSYAKILKHG